MTENALTPSMERKLQEVTPDAWVCAKLKSRGYTLQRIEEHFAGQYTLVDISYMIKKVGELNFALAVKSPDIVRQAMLSQIDDVITQMYELGNGALDEKGASIVLKALEQQSKLLGINKPEVVQVDVSTTIRMANETLTSKLENFRKSFKNDNVIDVTPAE